MVDPRTQRMPIGRGTALLPRRAATTAHASRHRRQKALAAVCAMRVLRQRANGAARCNAVALVLMQAGRVSPARTRTAAESTRCSVAAAVSTDINGKWPVCASSLCGRGMADPRANTAHASRSCHQSGCAVCVSCGCCGSSSCCYIRPSAARLLRAVASWLMRAGDTTGLLPRRAATTQHSTRQSVPATEGRRCWLLCVLCGCCGSEQMVLPDAMQWLWS